MARQVPDDRARQGATGRPVLGVLIGSLLLLGIAAGGYLIWAGAQSPDDPGTDAARSNVTGSTQGSSINPSSNVPPANPAYPAPDAQRSASPPNQ